MNKKISTSIAIIIIVVLAIIVGGIIIWQYLEMPKEEEKISEEITAKDETTDRKTYRNTEYGFEIKYPPDWEIYDHGWIIRILPSLSSIAEEMVSGELWPSFNIEIYDNPNNLSLREIFNEEILPNLRPEIDHKVQEVKVNNIDAITFIELGMIEIRSYIMIYDNRFIKIYFDNEEVIKGIEVVSTFHQILSTFRFID